jgi:hypothetical protein
MLLDHPTASDRLSTFLDKANLTMFSPRGLLAMVITSNPDDPSLVVTINVFNTSNPSTSDLNMRGLNFGEMDRGQMSLPTDDEGNQPPSRRSNRLQKMSTFISDYSDRKAHISPTSHASNLPLFSIISTISNSRESKRDSRKRRNNRFQRARPSSRSSGVNSVEGRFGVTKTGKPHASARRMRDGEDNLGQERHDEGVEIQPVRTRVCLL